jgi:hypothetical protein
MNRSLFHSARPILETLEDRCLPSSVGTSVISSNFNSTAIGAGNTLWFSSVFKVNGLGSSPVTLHFSNGTITVNGVSFATPNADVTLSPAVTTATTTFDAAANAWETTLPTHFSGNGFLDGFALPVPSGLPGGIKNVTWQGQFSSDTTGLSVNWQWAASVYTTFGNDYNALNVKPVDDNHASAYQNSDHAGTPEAFRPYVIGGATGGGGSNFTGSYSATAAVVPKVNQTGSLSGYVYFDANGDGVFDAGDSGLSGVVITLTGVNDLGVNVTMTATTDSTGLYTFAGLRSGTYSLSEAPSSGFTDEPSNVGTLGGTSGIDLLSAINLGANQKGLNYDFGELFAGS